MSASLKQLLVHLDDSPAAARRLEVASRLAAAHGCAVTGLYAVTPALVDVPFAAEAGAAAVSSLRELDDERRNRARADFDRARASLGAQAEWSQADAFPVTSAFVQQALYADLLVLGQRETGADGVPPDFVESVLIASGKPGLVVPYTGDIASMGETVAIAWKPTREAARAVAAALPLLSRASQVHVLSWGEQEEAVTDGSRLTLDGYLRRHGINAIWRREGGKEPDAIGELLLSRAFDVGANLLVMGCYGHNRAREWVLGGASRTLLQSMTMPVLMAH